MVTLFQLNIQLRPTALAALRSRSRLKEFARVERAGSRSAASSTMHGLPPEQPATVAVPRPSVRRRCGRMAVVRFG